MSAAKFCEESMDSCGDCMPSMQDMTGVDHPRSHSLRDHVWTPERAAVCPTGLMMHPRGPVVLAAMMLTACLVGRVSAVDMLSLTIPTINHIEHSLLKGSLRWILMMMPQCLVHLLKMISIWMMILIKCLGGSHHTLFLGHVLRRVTLQMWILFVSQQQQRGTMGTLLYLTLWKLSNWIRECCARKRIVYQSLFQAIYRRWGDSSLHSGW